MSRSVENVKKVTVMVPGRDTMKTMIDMNKSEQAWTCFTSSANNETPRYCG